MILCHKCAGVLAVEEPKDAEGLLSCQCMSGYVRGFEEDQTRTEAIHSQIKQQDAWINLFTQQGRSEAEIEKVRVKLLNLVKLLD